MPDQASRYKFGGKHQSNCRCPECGWYGGNHASNCRCPSCSWYGGQHASNVDAKHATTSETSMPQIASVPSVETMDDPNPAAPALGLADWRKRPGGDGFVPAAPA
jgi:hypothetical protein